MQDRLSIRCRSEDGASGLQSGPQSFGVDQVAVVRRRKRSALESHQKRLGIDELTLPGRGVSHVADGQAAGQFVQHFLVEDSAHESHGAMLERRLAVPCNDPRTLLPSVLKGVETQVCQPCGIDIPGHTEYAALIMKHVSCL